VALLLALPILMVAASVLQPGGEAWNHIAHTLLARYAGNTALLVVLVAYGVMSIGVVSAWLVANYRFPGVRVLEWALVLPLAARVLVPRDPLARRRRRRALLRAVSLRVSHCSYRVP